MKTYYIAIAYGYWGRGETEEAALKQCRKAGCGKKEKTLVYRVDVETEEHDGKLWLVLEGERIKAFESENEWKPWVDGSGTMAFYGSRTLVAEYIKGKRCEQTNVEEVVGRVLDGERGLKVE